MRQTFGVSIDDFGDGVLWGEAVKLTTVALSDPQTYLGAAAAQYAYPLSLADRVIISSLLGEKVQSILPEALMKDIERKAAEHVSDEERDEAAEQLATVSIFRNRDDFETQI